MRTIPQTYQKNGFAYSLVTRRGPFAIYEQRGAGGIAAFELVRLRIVKEAHVFGTTIEGGESLPSEKSWGLLGWTYSTYGGKVNADEALAQAEKALGEKAEEVEAAKNRKELP